LVDRNLGGVATEFALARRVKLDQLDGLSALGARNVPYRLVNALRNRKSKGEALRLTCQEPWVDVIDPLPRLRVPGGDRGCKLARLSLECRRPVREKIGELGLDPPLEDGAEGSDPDRDSDLPEGVVDRGPCCRLGRGHDADRRLGDGRVDEADPGDRDLDERLWIAG